MDLLLQTKELIKKTGLRPDKLKGQNFCIDRQVILEMVKTAKISKADTVLEAGPGFGFLTLELIQSSGKVIAVELEEKLFKNLKNLESLNKNLVIIHQDVLRYKIETLKHYKIVANLPYGISSAFLKKFLTAENKPQSITLLLQREVAERICAAAKAMSLLSVSVQLYSCPKIIKTISQKSFYPPPKVESAIIHLDRITGFPYTEMFSGLTERQAEKRYWQVVRAGFCSKRKTLENNLANSFHLPKNKANQALLGAGLNPAARAQELSLDDWLKLTFKLQSFIDETHSFLI